MFFFYLLLAQLLLYHLHEKLMLEFSFSVLQRIRGEDLGFSVL
jgi:hypothetical protein